MLMVDPANADESALNYIDGDEVRMLHICIINCLLFNKLFLQLI